MPPRADQQNYRDSTQSPLPQFLRWRSAPLTSKNIFRRGRILIGRARKNCNCIKPLPTITKNKAVGIGEPEKNFSKRREASQSICGACGQKLPKTGPSPDQQETERNWQKRGKNHFSCVFPFFQVDNQYYIQITTVYWSRLGRNRYGAK